MTTDVGTKYKVMEKNKWQVGNTHRKSPRRNTDLDGQRNAKQQSRKGLSLVRQGSYSTSGKQMN